MDNDELNYYKSLADALGTENVILKDENDRLIDMLCKVLKYCPVEIQCSYGGQLMRRLKEREGEYSVYD